MCPESSKRIHPENSAEIVPEIYAKFLSAILVRISTETPSVFPRCIIPETNPTFSVRICGYFLHRVLKKLIQKYFLGTHPFLQKPLGFFIRNSSTDFFNSTFRKFSKNFLKRFLEEISYQFLSIFLGIPSKKFLPEVLKKLLQWFLRILIQSFVLPKVSSRMKISTLSNSFLGGFIFIFRDFWDFLSNLDK